MRRAWGNLADSTRVTIANVSSEYKELEIALVKATNHIEAPPKEKHVRTIFLYTAMSRPRADVQYCIQGLAKRLEKTNDWLVALKCLIVIHRTLREGDPTFRDELLNYIRNKGYIFNLTNFRDESSIQAMEYSRWIKVYSTYLDERLNTFRILKYDVESERSSGHSKTRELDTVDLLAHLPALQTLLNRLMQCQPEGVSVSNFIIQAALSLVLKESFKLYRAINDGIINLVDKFFEMERHDASNALDIYKMAGSQAEKLAEFYDICKNLDLARSFQFPTLEQPPQSFLSTMEEYVKEGKAAPVKEEKIEKPLPPVQVEASKAEEVVPQPITNSAPIAPEPIVDLLGLDDFKAVNSVTPSDIEDSNALALAIVPQPNANGGLPPPQNNLGDFGTSGWELALVTAPSATSLQPATNINGGSVALAGGFDQLTLDSLYEDAIRRSPYSTPPASFNAGANQQQILALPAPPGAFSQQPSPYAPQDPFYASSKIAPPPSVQMAAMAQQQQNLMLGMPNQLPGYPAGSYSPIQQGYSNPLSPSSVGMYQPNMSPVAATNPFANPYGNPNASNPFAPAPVAQPQFYSSSNPFGNPNLL